MAEEPEAVGVNVLGIVKNGTEELPAAVAVVGEAEMIEVELTPELEEDCPKTLASNV